MSRKAGSGPATFSAEQKASLALAALEDKKANQPVLLDLRGLTLIADYFLICDGNSQVHVRGLVDGLMEAFAREGLPKPRVEGDRRGGWVLLDCGDLIVHVFAAEERQYYSLERLWGDAPRLAGPARADGPAAPGR